MTIIKKNNNTNDTTELVFILDRSGSMHGLEADTIGGFNSMLDKQRREKGKALVSTVLFNSESTVIHDRVPLDNVKELTSSDYFVGGCTALLDAVGEAIHHIKNVHKYIRREDVPGRTMFVIITDGLENASRSWSYERVKKAIEERKEKGWEFIFLGANIDAAKEAARFGISAERAVRYKSDSAGTELNYSVVSDAVSAFRAAPTCSASAAIPDNWKERIERDVKKRGM